MKIKKYATLIENIDFSLYLLANVKTHVNLVARDKSLIHTSPSINVVQDITYPFWAWDERDKREIDHSQSKHSLFHT